MWLRREGIKTVNKHDSRDDFKGLALIGSPKNILVLQSMFEEQTIIFCHRAHNCLLIFRTTQIYLPARGVATSVAEPLLACVTIYHTGGVMDATVASGGQ